MPTQMIVLMRHAMPDFDSDPTSSTGSRIAPTLERPLRDGETLTA